MFDTTKFAIVDAATASSHTYLQIGFDRAVRDFNNMTDPRDLADDCV